MNNLFYFPNGLKLAYSKNESVRSVSIGVFVGAGAICENEKNNGISHFIEHMLFKGTKKRSAFEIVAEIDGLGAKINAATSKQFTYFYTVSLDESFENCLDVLSDIFFNSTFPEDELERERNVVLEEIAESEDIPDDVCLERVASFSLMGHPLGMTILGKPESLQNLSRQDLFDYMNKFYTADNTVISVVGNIDFDVVRDLVDKYFAKQFGDNKKHQFETPKISMNCGKFNVSKKIEQVHTVMAFETIDYNDCRGNYALSLLSEAFASGMSSRLFQKIREKMGLCYSIFGYPSYLKTINGRYFICTSTNPQNAQKAIDAIKEEIKLLTTNGLEEIELNKAKKQALTSLVVGQESTVGVMRAYGRRGIMDNELFDIDKEIAAYESITLEEINELAKKVFDLSKMVEGQVGDF